MKVLLRHRGELPDPAGLLLLSLSSSAIEANMILPNWGTCAKVNLAKIFHNTTRLDLAKMFSGKNFLLYDISSSLSLELIALIVPGYKDLNASH